MISRAFMNSFMHRMDEGATAVGVDGMIAKVVSDIYSVKSSGFGQPSSDGEHDAIAEGNDCRSHILLIVPSLGDGSSTREESTMEVLADEAKWDHEIFYAESLTV